MNDKQSKLIPGLIGGAVIGALSTFPLIYGNCFCCMWIVLGGCIAAYVYSRRLPEGVEFRSGDGAAVGLLSGIYGALFGCLLFMISVMLLGVNSGEGFVDAILKSSEDLPPEVEDFLVESPTKFFLIMMLLFFGILSPLFGTLGGIIGVALFKKRVKKTETPPFNS